MTKTITNHSPDYVSALIASILGWTLDAFDFFILVFILPSVARDFGTTVPAIALSITVTLATRPVGAFIFGLLADRYGRKTPLIIDLVFYSATEFLSGLAPNYKTFLILRALFGIGMGGEWGVGASLAMEKVPAHKRGLLSGILQEGYAAGYLLAACCYFFVFPFWGWRAMFFIGGLPALVALFVRARVKESEVWQETRHQSWGDLVRGILAHWKVFLYITAMMTTMDLVGHGIMDMYPTFLSQQRGFSPRQVALIAVVYNIGSILGGIIAGWTSDRLGRRRSIMAMLGLGIFLIPLWAYASTTTLLVLGAFLMLFMVQGSWGVIPAHVAELSPDSVRGFLPGFAYQCGSLISASVVYIEAVLARQFSYSSAMAVTALISLSFAIALITVGHEKHRIEFGSRQASGLSM